MSLIGRYAWSRFVAITKPFFHSEARWRAIGLLSLLIALLLSVSGLNVVNSFVGRDFMTSISERRPSTFASLALLYASVFALSTLIAVFCRFTEERLGLTWRRWLTVHLAGRYFANRTYYRLNGRTDIDNPDQRLAEDVKAFTTGALSFVLILLNATITLLAFAGILWSITPWLFLAAVGYATVGSMLTLFLGRRMVGLDVQQLRKEANFRYELIRVRENAERVALLGGEANEAGRLRARLDVAVENMKRIIAVNRNLGFFTTGYNYMIQLIPLLIVAPLYMAGSVDFGTVTQSAMAFAHVMGAFSLIIVEFNRITSFAAVVQRLGSFCEAMENEAGPRPGGEEGTPEPSAPLPGGVEVTADEGRIAYEGLTLRTPKEGRLLIEDLSLEVRRGQHLLITGPHGAGRSALLRATAGLWNRGAGRIRRPDAGTVMFLPQQPYLVDGTLRDQLLYGGAAAGASDERLQAVLKAVRFEPVLQRVGGLDAEQDWRAVLSRGEQQQLAFARLLLAAPRFAFLDEATCALEASQARHLYDLLARTPTTYISVGSDPGLMDYHALQLELGGNGAWKMVPHSLAVSA